MQIACHCRDLLFFALVMLGPLPFAVRLSLTATHPGQAQSRTQLIFLVLLFWCLLETSVGLALGATGFLTLAGCLTAQAALFAAGCISLRRSRASARQLLFAPFRPLTLPESAILGTLLAIGAVVLVRLLSSPITNFDSLMYHLPTMAKWYVSGLFRVLKPDDMIGYYPYNWEALCALFLFPFREDFAVTLPNLVAWAILGLSIYLAARRLHAGRVHAMGGAAIALITPLMIDRIHSMEIDIPMAAFFLSGLCLLFLRREMRLPIFLLAFLGSVGMLCGVKASGLLYAFVLLGAWTAMEFLCIVRRRPHALTMGSPRQLISAAIFGAALFVLLGGFWYIRNLVMVGNPFGLVPVTLAGRVVFPGSGPDLKLGTTILANMFDLRSPEHWSILWLQLWRQFHLTFLVLSAGLPAVVPLLFRPRRAESRLAAIQLLALLSVTILLYWYTPFSGGAPEWKLTPWMGQALRYAFPALGVLAILAILGSNAVRLPSAVVAGLVVVCAILNLNQMMSWPLLLTLSVCATVAVYFGKELAAVWSRPGNRYRAIRYGAAAAGLLLVVLGTANLRAKRDSRRDEAYGSVLKFVETQIRTDQRIGVVKSFRSYPLFGRHLDHKIVHVPAPATRDVVKWIRGVAQKRIDFLAIGPVDVMPVPAEEVERMLDPFFVRVLGRDCSKETVIYAWRHPRAQ